MPPYTYLIQFAELPGRYSSVVTWVTAPPLVAGYYDKHDERESLRTFAGTSIPSDYKAKRLFRTGYGEDNDKVIAVAWDLSPGDMIHDNRSFSIQVRHRRLRDDGREVWLSAPRSVTAKEAYRLDTLAEARRLFERIDLTKLPSFTGARIIERVRQEIIHDIVYDEKPPRLEPAKEIMLQQNGVLLKYRLVDDEDDCAVDSEG